MGVPAHLRAFYNTYMHSPAWKARRALAISTAGRCCQHIDTTCDGRHTVRCPRTRYLTVHHRHYGSLGNEAPEDLEVLCWVHHMAHHLMSRRCRACVDGVFPSIEDAVDCVLGVAGETEDHTIINWKTLPSQAECFAAVPELCPACSHLLESAS